MKLVHFLITIFAGLVTPAVADLLPADLSWGGDGMVEEPGCGPDCYARVDAMVARPDGRLLMLVTEVHQQTQPFHNDYRLRLRAPDGSLEAEFDSGVVMTSALSYDETGAIAVQPDGKILVAGRQNRNCVPGGSCELWLSVVRLMPDGSRDASFGQGGRFEAQGDGSAVSALGIAPDGDIIFVAGRAYRLTSAGQPDATYGNGGKSDLLGSHRSFVLPDGKVLAWRQSGRGFAITRLGASGHPDPAFNGTGTRDYQDFGACCFTFSPRLVALQGDRIVVVGGNWDEAYQDVLVRLLPDGAPDPSLGTGGMRRVSHGGIPGLLAIDARQRMVVVATFRGSPYSHFVRWLPDGTRDEIVSDAPQNQVRLMGVSLLVPLLNGKAMVAVIGGTQRWGRNALDSNQEFVLQQYRDFLSREGDAAGVAYWRGRLEDGTTTRGAVASSFLASPEFQGRVAPIARLYFAYFLRVPDYGGLLHWATFRDAHQLPAVSNAFASSQEFANRYGSADNEAFVQLVYQNVLGREPDGAGLVHWTGQLDSGAMTRGEVMLAFSEGDEFRVRAGNETLVAITYAGMLRREPEADGFAFWVDYLDDGNSPTALIELFLGSGEYRGRFAP
jgi:uncharacterized delta-60 repeat protein